MTSGMDGTPPIPVPDSRRRLSRHDSSQTVLAAELRGLNLGRRVIGLSCINARMEFEHPHRYDLIEFL